MNQNFKDILKECFDQPMIGEKVQYKFYSFSEKTEPHIIDITRRIVDNIDSEHINDIIVQCMQEVSQYSYIKGFGDGLYTLKDINT